MAKLNFPVVYLLHGTGGSPDGSVKQLEAELRGCAPEQVYVRPIMPHSDPTAAPSVSVSYLRDLGIPEGSLIIGLSLGGLVAAKLQEAERPDLHVFCINSPTWAGDTELHVWMKHRVSLYSSGFWALALNRTDDYARAGVPMLPVVAGRAATTRQILIYSGLLVLASELPWGLGFAGAIYGATVAICGALFLLFALQLNMSTGADRRAAHRLFLFSISYLFVLFAALLIDHGGGSFPPYPGPHAGIGRGHAEAQPGAAHSGSGLITLSAREV